MVRTVSPYFSSKKASAPPSIASGMVMNAMETGRSSRMMRWTSSSMRVLLVVGQGPVEREVEAQVVGRDQRPGLARPLPDDVAQRAVEQVRPRVVAHRVGAALGVDDGLDRLPDPQPPVERAVVDDQPAMRPLGVGHGEQLAAATGLADDALVADLAAALGVERRLVEDDLGLAVAGQLVELHPVAQDGNDPALGGRRLVAEEPGVADAALDRAVQRDQLGVLREVGLLARPAPIALLGRAPARTRRGRRGRRIRRRARRSGRPGSRTYRGAGTRRRRTGPGHRRERRPAAAR